MTDLLTKHFHARKVAVETGSVIITFKTVGNLKCRALEPTESTYNHLCEFVKGALALCDIDFEIPSVKIGVHAIGIGGKYII